jgi:hypothetical protein
MNKIFKMGLIGIIFLSLSCNKNEKGVIPLKIGKVTEIKQGETAENSQKGLSLQVKNIDDGRCPIGVNCVWEGNAAVEFHLTTKKREIRFYVGYTSPTKFQK